MSKKNKNPLKKPTPFVLYEGVILILTSVALILTSIRLEGWWQTLFISLGTGVIASALVSFAFWLIQIESEKRVAFKRRNDFMEQFKILSYNVIDDLNMAHCQGTTLSLNDYIKMQHRWFHDYYKRIIAENYSNEETELRIKQVTEFIDAFGRDMKDIFDTRVVWEDGNFSEWQLKELKGLYSEFCNSANLIENKDYKQAFLRFAEFLEVLKRIMTEDDFEELKNFNLLRFKFDEIGHMNRIDDEFYEQETMFKFAKEFNAIRRNNYKKYYGKDSVSEQGEQNNG